MRRFLNILNLILVFVFIANISFASSFPLTVKDDVGRKVTITKEPKRIISTAPSVTETLFALGLEEKIVGVTTFCNYPEEAKTKEKIGTFQSPNIEKILALKPDLIIATGGVQRQVVEKLEELGIPVFVSYPRTLEEVIKSIYTIGRICGAEKNAKNLAFDLKLRVAKVTTKAAKAKSKPKVFFELWHEPLMSAGPGSFIDDLIKKAGGINIAGSAKSAYPIFSLEQLIKEDPDIIIGAESSMGGNPLEISKRPGWDTLKAVRNQKIYTINDDIVFRSGPRLVLALEIIARYLHPDLFK
ncbi:MAG: cobalamin-binding protein [bacterium]|nr:cobalamin-binding protein [bacterium]